MRKYIAIEKVINDNFISEYYLINYINIGRASEMRLNNLSIKSPKCLNDCIVYLDEEVEVLKKYHPKATILHYFGRVNELNRMFI